MIKLTRFLTGLVVLGFFVTACSGGVQIDTPLKKWVVAAESYNAVKMVAVELTVAGHLSLSVAEKALVIMKAGDKVVLGSHLLIVNGNQQNLTNSIFLLLGYTGELQSIVEEFK